MPPCWRHGHGRSTEVVPAAELRFERARRRDQRGDADAAAHAVAARGRRRRARATGLGATLCASFGFMLPISTAPNAMAYGTGHLAVSQMMGAGLIFDLIGFAVIVGGLRGLCPLLGLSP